jgi:N-acetylneuraminic acid mutarotase
LPGEGVFVATAAATTNALFVFGGMTYDATGKPQPSRAAWRLQAGRWERLADLPAARVGANGPSPILRGDRILIIGGYAEVFGGAQREHPGFPAETLLYDVSANRWSFGPSLPVSPVGDRDASSDPGPLPMIGAPVAIWNDLVVVVSGEVRIATRSPAVVALRLPLSR